MPLPEDEASWDKLDVIFATASGRVRRNKLSDFAQVNRSGKIAMKLDEGDSILGVAICSEADDVLLTTAQGQCIRFPVGEVRVFKGRDSTGVRGIALGKGDHLISMAILRHVEATPEERAAYLRMRRAVAGEAAEEQGPADAEEVDAGASLSHPSVTPSCRPPRRSSSPFPKTAMASDPRLMNIASPGAAAKASPPWW